MLEGSTPLSLDHHKTQANVRLLNAKLLLEPYEELPHCDKSQAWLHKVLNTKGELTQV